MQVIPNATNHTTMKRSQAKVHQTILGVDNKKGKKWLPKSFPSLDRERLMYRPQFPKYCASVEQERTFHPCLKRLQTAWESFSLSLTSVQHFATLLKCVSCQIVPKTVVGQANASLEKPLCITVWTSHCEVCPSTFLPPVKHNTWEGAWAEVWFLAKCAIVVRELATQPGKPWVRVHQFLSFCRKPRLDALVHMFDCLYIVHVMHCTGSIEHVAVRRVDDEVKLTC